MTTFGRALLGATLGALLTLILHPTSRPYLATLLVRAHPGDLAAQLYLRSERLPAPTTPAEAALWLHMAADRTLQGKDLTAAECSSVLKIAEAAAKKEPDNAFWHQMRAVFLDRSGNRQKAVTAWVRASKSQAWNDYQSELLGTARSRIAGLTGSHQAWHMAYVYYARSDSAAKLIEMLARSMIADLDQESPATLDLRYVTLRNGSLLRDFSRSMKIGLRGADIVELASYPKGLSAIRSPKKLLLAQVGMINSLIKEGRHEQATQVFESFGQNDAWRAMTHREDYEQRAIQLGLQSAFVPSLPSALFLCGLFGCFVWALGGFIERQKLSPWVVATVAASLGFLTFFLSQSLLSSLAIALCAAFLSFGLDRGRQHRTDYVGPLFTFLTSLLALAFILTFVLYVTGFALPTISLVPLLGVPGEFFGNRSMFIGLAAIVFGLLLMAAPAWSLAQHRSTTAMLSLALRRFGAVVGVGCLVLATLSAPVCIFWDQSLDVTWTQLVGNEPVYYLIQ